TLECTRALIVGIDPQAIDIESLRGPPVVRHIHVHLSERPDRVLGDKDAVNVVADRVRSLRCRLSIDPVGVEACWERAEIGLLLTGAAIRSRKEARTGVVGTEDCVASAEVKTGPPDVLPGKTCKACERLERRNR